jgi:hypothetical protein
MNDQELAAAVRKSVEGAHMRVPEEEIVGRSRVIRAARRRRLAVGVTVVAAAAAAAITATLVLPGPVAQHAQDTAYVVSHATGAIEAVPSGTIFYMQSTVLPPGPEVVRDTWSNGRQYRTETFKSGQLVSETGSVITSTTSTFILINYQDRTWTSVSASLDRPPAASAAARARARSTCDNTSKVGIPLDASRLAARIQTWETCGWLKADGTATIGGATAIRLTMALDGGATGAWYVDPATYLPIHYTVTERGGRLPRLATSNGSRRPRPTRPS